MIIKELLYPRRCPVCDRPAPFGRLACEKCVGLLQKIKGATCMKCGRKLSESEDEYCYSCSREKHYYDRGFALYEYSCINQSIYRFKYSGRQEYADFYGKEMALGLGRVILNIKPDIIIPVPLHSSKYKLRGYNQADLIGRKLAYYLDIPYSDSIIKRSRKTIPMKELDASQRQINLKNAFIVCDNDVKLNKVLIIDDIYTTGSTVDSMAVELKRKGVESVYFAALSIGAGM